MKFNLFLLLLFFSAALQAQEHSDTLKYSINTRINAGSGATAPFLSTANQYDRYSFAPNSLTAWGTLHKDMSKTRIIDYGFGLELDGNGSKTETRFFADEYYILAKLFFMNLSVGSKREVFGNQDAELSSGGMLFSQNSRPMPRVSLQTNGYLAVPYTKGYVEVKGGLSHGWFDDNIGIKGLLLHHKYASVRVGGSFPLNINYGIQHVAQWGGVSSTYGTMPVTWDNYFRIFLGKSGNAAATQSDQINTLGNHIISQNLGLDISLKPVTVSLYWQNLTEDPPIRMIYHSPNIADGLWGMAVRFHNFKLFSNFAVEFLSTTDQSGPWHDLDGVIYGGADPYYNNSQIPGGWSYRGMTIGNPWLTSPKYNKNGSLSVTNNLVRLYYFSGKGAYKSLDYKLTLAYSENFGTTNPSYENCKKQFSYQLETSTVLRFMKNTKVSLALSGDKGTQYGNNFAILLGLSYTGVFGF